MKQALRFIPEQMRNGKGRSVPGWKQLGPAEGQDKITSRLRTILQTEAHRPRGLGGRPGVFSENGMARPGLRAWEGQQWPAVQGALGVDRRPRGGEKDAPLIIKLLRGIWLGARRVVNILYVFMVTRSL